jgi:hypothetical protein
MKTSMSPSCTHCSHTACVAGITMQRTPSATVLPRSTSAAARMSSMRPFVQLPITAWSMATSRLSATGRVLEGRCGQATVGTTSAASM